jgi:hypothetical protein
MPCDQEIVGVLKTENLDAHEFVANDHGVRAVREKVLHPLQPRQRFALSVDETNVVAKKFDGAP